jgi:hypothetical protein
MKRTSLSAAVALVVTTACVENRTSIEITGRAAPGDPTSCKFAPGGDLVAGPGTLDVSFADKRVYAMEVYVTNNLADPKATVPEASTETKSWRAEAAHVRVNPSGYSQQFASSPALAPVSGENVLPLDGQTTSPGGKSVQYVDVVSHALGDVLAGAVPAGGAVQVVLGITLEGQTLDGARVDSGEFFFPLLVCDGCLQPKVACTATQKPVSTGCFEVGQDRSAVCQ